MDSSDNSNDCQGDNDHTSVSEPVSQMLTPEPAPLDVPHPSTPPAQGPVLCSASSGGSSEITTLSLSSPPLTPPPRVMRRLTPLDRFSPRKRANSIDDDLETHASRRLLLLDQRTARSAAHTDAVCKKLSCLQQQKLRKRELLLEKLSKAVKNRQDYVNRKRLIASSTVRHICSAGSSDDARSMEMCVSHEQGPCCYSFADSFKSVAGLSVWENLRRVPIFVNFEDAVGKTDIENTYRFINSREIVRLTSSLFAEIDVSGGLVEPFLLARCFLFGFAILVEKDKHERYNRAPMYAVRLNATQPFFDRLAKDFPNLKQHHLDDSYYGFLVAELHTATFHVWKLFQRLVQLNGPEFETYAFKEALMAGYYPVFQVFKFNHWFRSLALLSESNDGLSKHLGFLRTMRSLTADNDVLLNEYRYMIRKGESFIKANKERFARLQGDGRVAGLASIDAMEQEFVARHKAAVLSGSSLTDDNPLISVSSRSRSTLRSAAQRPVSLVPPTFSVDNWRKYLFKVLLEFRSRGAQLRMRTGKSPRLGAEPLAAECDLLAEYVDQLQPDIEAIREWLGLKTYNEGCIEAIERLSYLDSVESMMVDVVQMVERCLYAMFVVVEDSKRTVNLVFAQSADHRRENSTAISFLSDSVLVLSKLHSGKLRLAEYFEMSLGVLICETPDFLRCEAESLLAQTAQIDKAFIQRFVEFVKDCMVFGMNNCVKSCLRFIGSNIVEFERDVFACNYPSSKVSLNLRYPNLYKQMQLHKEQEPAGGEPTAETATLAFYNRLFAAFVCSSNTGKLYEMPEFLESFSIQLMELSNQVRTLVTLQSVTVILMSSLATRTALLPAELQHSFFADKSRQQLVDFGKLLVELDGFLLNYFEHTESNRLGNFFKEEVYKILCTNVSERLRGRGYEEKAVRAIVDMNFDFKHVCGLIAQTERASIGSPKVNSLKTIYCNAIYDIIRHGRVFSASTSTSEPVRRKSAEVENILQPETHRAYSKFYAVELVRDKIDKIVRDYYAVFNVCVEVHFQDMYLVLREFEEICAFERRL
ncbi:hypothetical protein KL942_001291 [Ogataea angusta]|uniref:Uncharacterized protein n=1 Tax=Pichia angusta TaxID=870730 RepID=A0ABQ7S0Y0_PICAN|nr:hypothetical protein KL942_001291 [Ogataea angusta]KAG7851011.1 hypothetical protein KL940_001588 [Ogataea angusta]